MPEDAYDREHHAGKVAVGVPNKNLCGIPVMPPKSEGNPDEGQKQVEREEMRVGCRVKVRREGREVEKIIDYDEEGNDD